MKNNWPRIIFKYLIVFLVIGIIVLLFYILSSMQIEQNLSDHKIWVEFSASLGTFIVAFIALSPFIGRLLIPTKITLGLDEKINIVISEDLNSRKIQAGLNFINSGKKDLLINRVIVELVKRGDAIYVLDWNMFISDFFGKGTIPSRRPVPVKVDVNKNHYEMIQFFRENPIMITPGKYTLRVKIWVNQRSISETARFTQSYNFTVTENDQQTIEKERIEISKGKEPKWRMISIPIDNWNFNNYD